MTKTTEELKREMYKSLANLKGRIEINYSVKDALHGVDDLEGTIEEYLEALRSEHALTCESLQEATHRIAGNEQTITLLCRVVKDQYAAQASLQSLLKTAEAERNREQAEAHRQIDTLELSRRSWMDEAKSLEGRNSVLGAEVSSLSVRLNERDRLIDHIGSMISMACRPNQNPDLSVGLESLARQIYQSWESKAGYVPWVDGGNSAKQDEARKIASRTFELALADQGDPK